MDVRAADGEPEPRVAAEICALQRLPDTPMAPMWLGSPRLALEFPKAATPSAGSAVLTRWRDMTAERSPRSALTRASSLGESEDRTAGPANRSEGVR